MEIEIGLERKRERESCKLLTTKDCSKSKKIFFSKRLEYWPLLNRDYHAVSCKENSVMENI